jgi:outer membrane protein TolC
MAAQQDLIRVRAEQTVLAGETLNLKGEIRRASVRINSLVGDPLDVELGPPAALPETAGFEQAWQQLQRAPDAAPALAEADAAVRGGRAARELAARERYPDVALGVAPVEMDGQFESWQLKLKVEVPLWGTRSARESEQVAMLALAERRRDAARLGVTSAAADAWAAYQAATERQQLFETELQSEATLNLRSALAGYQGGEVDFDTVIEAERQLRDTRLQALAAAVERQRAVASFERITGVLP